MPPNTIIIINEHQVDPSSIVLEGVDSFDAPEFVDAYIQSARFMSGDELNDSDLEQLAEKYPEVVTAFAGAFLQGQAEYNRDISDDR